MFATARACILWLGVCLVVHAPQYLSHFVEFLPNIVVLDLAQTDAGCVGRADFSQVAFVIVRLTPEKTLTQNV